MKFNTTHNPRVNPPLVPSEPISTEPRLTIDDEAYTIQELMTRAKQGMPMPDTANALYLDQEDLDKINKFYRNGLDLTDLDELRKNTERQAILLKTAIQTAKDSEEEERNAIVKENYHSPEKKAERESEAVNEPLETPGETDK